MTDDRGRPMLPRLTLPKSHRLRRPSEFKAVYGAKQRAGDYALLVFALRNRLPHSRLGLSVSKKNGNAVRRNRIKRLLREAFRLEQHDLPPDLDVILIPRPTEEPSLSTYRRSLRKLAFKLDRRIPAGDVSTAP